MRQKRLLCFYRGFGAILVFVFVMALGMTAFAASDKTMKNKKWVTDQCGESSEYEQYYKINISKQGYIMVDLKTSALPGDKNGEGSIEVSTLNAKKKGSQYFSVRSAENGKYSYAVKKGTYYLKVTGNDIAYKLRYTFTPVKVSKAGKGFSKAAAIKKGATIKNLLFDEDEHYYKLTLKKKTKVVLACNSKIVDSSSSFGSLSVQIWKKEGKKYGCVNRKGQIVEEVGAKEINIIDGKATLTYTLPKGTYYLRTCNLKGNSGYYTLKWK